MFSNLAICTLSLPYITTKNKVLIDHSRGMAFLVCWMEGWCDVVLLYSVFSGVWHSIHETTYLHCSSVFQGLVCEYFGLLTLLPPRTHVRECVCTSFWVQNLVRFELKLGLDRNWAISCSNVGIVSMLANSHTPGCDAIGCLYELIVSWTLHTLYIIVVDVLTCVRTTTKTKTTTTESM